MDLVEESMRMIRGLQSLARTQSSQYMLNDSNWVLLSEHLLLELCLMVKLTPNFADFSSTSNGNC